ncbi:MAG: hypothetical protein AB7R90_22265, partial [Reyranellaceae bacterium]
THLTAINAAPGNLCCNSRMSRYRALLSLLLCLALPLQGLAAVMLPSPCPMAALAAATGQAATSESAHQDMSAQHAMHRADCCDEAGQPGGNGQPCQMDKACLATPTMAPPPPALTLDLIAASTPGLALVCGPTRLRLAGIWRPPSRFL